MNKTEKKIIHKLFEDHIKNQYMLLTKYTDENNSVVAEEKQKNILLLEYMERKLINALKTQQKEVQQ